jgi:tRNA (guanine-N7-)-methyltransferase
MSAPRVRQHVNPLSSKYQSPAIAPDWSQVYAEPSQPLHLDIGCARGQFLLEMAQLQPDRNFLGVEIREPLVLRANELRNELGLRNLHYLFCNINVSLEQLLGPSSLDSATIQFPDPWFKKRHQKRRVAQPELVQTLAMQIKPGGYLFVQSDVLEIAEQMYAAIDTHPKFQPSPDSNPWLPHNPLAIATEREQATLSEGKPVYRAWFTRIEKTAEA